MINPTAVSRYLACLVVGVAFAGPASPAGIANGQKVVGVRVDKSAKGYVIFEAPLSGTPAACGSTHNRMLGFDTSVDAGKAIMSLALAAQMANRPMVAEGTGTCTIYGVVEDWSYGWTQ